MNRKLLGASLALILALGLNLMLRADDAAKPEEKGELKTVACDPSCGFSVTSRDEKEIVAIVKAHAKSHHNMDLTDEQVKSMIKPADKAAMPKEEKNG